MKKEELENRAQEINRIVNLLSTFGDHYMSEESLLRVSEAYEKYYHFLFNSIDIKFVLNNLFLTLASVDLFSAPTKENMVRDIIFLATTGTIDKYLISHFINGRMELKKEREWIKKFKERKNNEPDAPIILKKKLKAYQEELEMIQSKLNEINAHQKIKK